MKKIRKINLGKYILKDPKVRRELAKKSHFWFFHIYLSQYITYKTSPFQKEMFYLTQASDINAVVITAFRGSGKSTIMSLSYPIWAMIGVPQKKYIIILSQTQQICKLILSNIRVEFEKNELLKNDFGPFRQISEISEGWSQNTLRIDGYGCRISSISSGESIRGIRHKQYRPDLIIIDDVEDLQSVKTKEGRDKTYSWLTGDVIPAGDRNTKTVVVGNKLHEDGLMMRLKKAINDGSYSAKYREYPFLNCNGLPLWKEKFVNQAQIDKLKSSVGSEASWQREYLLKIIPEDEAIILRDWITYYDSLPEDNKELRYIATGIDLAISQNEASDYTAMVSAYVYGDNENSKIYILPYPINKRMSFPETVESVKNLSLSLGRGKPTELFIEDVGYQRSLIEELFRQGYPATGVKVMGQDKRQRLTLTAYLIKSGKISFPKKGCEELTSQLVGFGYESHDDLADAFAILILKIQEIILRYRPKVRAKSVGRF